MIEKVREIELVASKLVETFLSGNYRSVFRGQGIEFDEVREYVPGDDVRLIDWNVTSRMGGPYTKTFREERELILFLVTDVSASIFHGSGKVNKFELASFVFAVLGISAAKNNDKVGALYFTEKPEKWVPPARGKKHVLRLVNDLVEMKPLGKGSDLGLALRTVGEVLKRRSICVVISDFKTADYWDELMYVSQKHDVVAIKLVDPQDYVFPKIGIMELEDPEDGDILLAESISPAFRKKYHDFWMVHQLTWKSMCRRRGVATLEIGTDDDAGLKLFEFFQSRKRK